LTNKGREGPVFKPTPKQEEKSVESDMPVTGFTSKYARERALEALTTQELAQEEYSEEEEEALEEEKKPPMDLFKSIFDEDSDTE
jgi:hypothetical protein